MPSVNLEEVKCCLFSLSAYKITERKKAAERIGSLLNNDTIVQQIHTNSQGKRRPKWDDLLESSIKYLLKESEKLEKDERSKENPSNSVSLGWANKKREIISLPKLVLKKALSNARAAGNLHISLTSLYDFMILILDRNNHTYLLENYASYAIQIMQETILLYPQYYFDITQDQWKVLLQNCIWVYTQNVSNTSLLACSAVIEGIVRHFRQSRPSAQNARLQEQFLSPSIILKRLPPFIIDAFNNPEFSKQLGLQRALLSLLYTTCFTFQYQWRWLLCIIGEKTMGPVLSMWEKSGRQTLLFKYLRLQLAIHHPQQDGEILDGSELCLDKEQWQICLHQMYRFVIDYVNESPETNPKLYTYNKPHDNTELILFGARLLFQILSQKETSSELDVTQKKPTEELSFSFQRSFISNTQNSQFRKSQKLNIEIGYQPMLNLLYNEGTISGRTIWFQIISEMLTHYGRFFDTTKISQMLDLFFNILKRSKCVAVSSELLRCLNNLTTLSNISEEMSESCYEKWSQVFDLTTRFVAGKQCVNSGTQLLSTLIDKKLGVSHLTLLKLFCKGAIVPNEEGLFLLRNIITNFPLPVFIECGDVRGNQDPRLLLVKHLFPLSDDCSTDGMEDPFAIEALKHPKVLSSVIYLLTLQNPIDGSEPFKMEASDSNSFSSEMRDLEKFYLTSLGLYVDEEKASDKNLKSASSGRKSRPEVLEFVIQRISDYFNQMFGSEVPAQNYLKDFTSFVSFVELIVHLNGQLQSETLSRVFVKLSIMPRFLDAIQKSNGRDSEIQVMILRLQSIYRAALQVLEQNPCVKHLLGDLVTKLPQTFQDQILNMISSYGLVLPFSSPSLDSFSDDFDDDVTMVHSVEPDIEDEFDDSTSQISLENEVQNFLSHESLDIKEKNLLGAFEFLGLLFDVGSMCDLYDDDDGENSAFVKSCNHFSSITDSVIKENKVFTTNGLRILLSVARMIFISKFNLFNVDDAIMLVSKISGKYSSDCRVASAVLLSFKDLLVINGSQITNAQKTNIIHIVTAYADKYRRRDYGCQVGEALFDLVVQFCKIDPLRTWSLLSKDSDDRVGEIFGALRSPYYDLRMKAAQNLYLLFNEGSNPLSLKQQTLKIQKVYQVAVESLNVQGDLSADFQRDEDWGRLVTFLTSFVTIARTSPFLETNALFALLSSVKRHKVNIQRLKLAIKTLATIRNLSLPEYLQDNLEFLIIQWIKDKNPLEDFPFLLLNAKNFKEFFDRHSKAIVLSVFLTDLSLFPTLESVSQIQVSAMIENNFASCVASILPYLIASKRKGDERLTKFISEKKVDGATNRWKFIEQNVADRENLFDSHLGVIVQTLIKNSHDPESWFPGEVIIAPSTTPCFESCVVVASVEQISPIFYANSLCTIKKLAERKRPVQLIVRNLVEEICTAGSLLEQRWALAKVETFLDIVLPCLGLNLLNLNVFVVSNLLNVLSHHVVKSETRRPIVAKKCLLLFGKIVDSCFQVDVKYLIHSIPLLTNRLLSLHANDHLWPLTSDVISKIMYSNNDLIQKSVGNLPPIPKWPNTQHLEGLREQHRMVVLQTQRPIDLKSIVESFIQTSLHNITSFHFNYLADMLTEKKTDIWELYLIRYDGCSLAHCLMQHLVLIVSSTKDSQLGILGISCLSQLGPVDLRASIFAVNDESKRLKKSSDLSHTIILLARLSTCFEVSKFRASIDCLSKMLSSTLGLKALKCLNDPVLELKLAPLIPPFQFPGCVSENFESLNSQEYQNVVQNPTLWALNNDFDKWVMQFTSALIKTGCKVEVFHFIAPVCEIDASFCCQVLPYVVHQMLKVDETDRRVIFSAQISKFIDRLSGTLEQNNLLFRKGVSIESCKRTLSLIIDVINYLRTQPPTTIFSARKKFSSWERNWWLDLDYFKLAKASYLCGSHFSAILFSEIACDAANDLEESRSKSKLSDRQLPPLQRIENKDLSSFLLKVYSDLGESDGVEGCSGVCVATNTIAQSTLGLHQGNLIQSLTISDSGLYSPGLVEGLKTAGMYNVLHSVTQSLNQTKNPRFLEAQYESCWRLRKWDEADVTTGERENEGFHQLFWKGLSCVRHNDMEALEDLKLTYSSHAINFLQRNCNESASGIYRVLTQLQIFSEFNQLAESILFTSNNQFEHLLAKCEDDWNEKERYGSIDPSNKELILAARIALVQTLIETQESFKESFEPLFFKLLIQESRLGNSSRHKSIVSMSHCHSALLQAKKLPLTADQKWQLVLEEANMSLRLNNQSQVISMLKNLLSEILTGGIGVKPWYELTAPADLLSSGQFKHQPHITSLTVRRNPDNKSELEAYFKASILCGEVLIESKSQSPRSVLSEYFLEPIKLMETNKDISNVEALENSYHQLAKFGDRLHQDGKVLLSSDVIHDRKQQIDASKGELDRVVKLLKDSKSEAHEKKELLRRQSFLDKDIKREQNEIQKLEEEVEHFLQLALENYLKCLSISSSYGTDIFRVVALWLQNVVQPVPNSLVKKYVEKIKSHQFIPLLYQLVARLTLINDIKKHHSEFPTILNSIIMRVCKEHPHHGLPVLLMLAHSHLEDEIIETKFGPRNKRARIESVEEDRVLAAKILVENLSKFEELGPHIAELKQISVAYMKLLKVYKTKPTTQTSTFSLSRDLDLMKLRNLQYATPLTRLVTVQPSGHYRVPLIKGWESKGCYVGGVNAPIRLSVIATDGIRTNELLKGNDDLRQDAVLEQVFNVVNELLYKDSDAKKKRLSLKTYVVAPLSQKTGLIQWCDNTVTLGSHLVKMHSVYNPDDWTEKKCRAELYDIRLGSQEEKRSKFETILKNYKPVFRYFFYEEYSRPDDWFSHRQSYVRSLATSSIAGYILGLGDRHCENILIDKDSAEVIHIDLGIAFEMGKLLPTPERVPFRMSQNLVDGCGVLGTEGALRNGMRVTMRVLREFRFVLETIVEVLKHDPLYHWSLSPHQVAKLNAQGEHKIVANTDCASEAKRALSRVQDKLTGIVDGFHLSVDEHVNVLLQQSTDNSNLSQMFCGWQAYI